jgi:hypothetical protein
MAMRIPPTDYEMRNPDAGVTEEEFHSRKNLKEGVNGCDSMDTRFENTMRSQVLSPRGDKRGRPMPRDARFANADNHGEWGPDRYVKRFEYGADGPKSKELYKGLGLPTTPHLSPTADPVDRGQGGYGGLHEDCFGDGALGYAARPMDQGIGDKDA